MHSQFLSASNIVQMSDDEITDILFNPNCNIQIINAIISNKSDLSAANIALISEIIKKTQNLRLILEIERKIIESQTRLPETIILDYMNLTKIPVMSQFGQTTYLFSYETARYIIEHQKNISEGILRTLMQEVGSEFISEIIKFQEDAPASIIEDYIRMNTNQDGRLNLIAAQNLVMHQKHLSNSVLVRLIEQTQTNHHDTLELLKIIVERYENLSDDILERIMDKATHSGVCDESVLVKIVQHQQSLDVGIIDNIIAKGALDAEGNLPGTLFETLTSYYSYDMMRHEYIGLSADFLEMRRELNAELDDDNELPKKVDDLLSSKQPLLSLYSAFMRPFIDREQDSEEFEKHEELIRLLRQFDVTPIGDSELTKITSQITGVIKSFNEQSKSYLNRMFTYYAQLSEKIDNFSKGQELGKIMKDEFHGHQMSSQHLLSSTREISNVYEEAEPPHVRLPQLHFEEFETMSNILTSTDTSNTSSISQESTSSTQEHTSDSGHRTSSFFVSSYSNTRASSRSPSR